MDYVIGGGIAAVILAAASLWFAIRRYHAKEEKERKRTVSLEKRRAKQAAANMGKNPFNGSAGLSNNEEYNPPKVQVGREMYGRGEHQ